MLFIVYPLANSFKGIQQKFSLFSLYLLFPNGHPSKKYHKTTGKWWTSTVLEKNKILAQHRGF